MKQLYLYFQKIKEYWKDGKKFDDTCVHVHMANIRSVTSLICCFRAHY